MIDNHYVVISKNLITFVGTTTTRRKKSTCGNVL